MSEALFKSTPSPYLLSHSVGLLPKSSASYFQQHYFQAWEAGTAELWPQWLQDIELFRQQLARLLNTDIDSLCPQTNISSALTKFIGALPMPAKNKNIILLAEEDFPSMGFVIRQMTAFGFDFRFIPKNGNLADLDLWSDYLRDDIAVAFITHVQSNTGLKIPFEDICQLCQDRSVVSIVDIAQSVGVVPVNLHNTFADCVLGTSVKWLCGGPGAAFMWVSPALWQTTEPVDLGWFSHENPFEFDIHNFRFAANALKFWGGTPSVAPFIIAGHSIGLMHGIGIEKVAAHNLACRRILSRSLPPELNASPKQESLQSGTLILKSDHRLESALDKLAVQYDVRETGIRLSPHIYTTLETIEEITQALLAAL